MYKCNILATVTRCVNNTIIRRNLSETSPLLLDSLDCIELVMEFERKFKIKITDVELGDLQSTKPQTIEGLTKFIQSKL